MTLGVRTATILFTDLENSTHLWEQFPEAMRSALARHDALMKQVVDAHHGRIVKTTGDGFHAVFETASDGAAATLAAQQALRAETWPSNTGPLKARMGLHTGECQERDGDYYGTEVNRAARIMGLAYGGQVLVSEATAALIHNSLPAEAALTPLGRHRLKGFAAPEPIFQLTHPQLPASFPPLSAAATHPSNLPLQLTSFIGREKEISEIRSALETARLVTLTGSGGTGKTRLSIEVGAQELDRYADGVWLIELAPLRDDAQLVPAVAKAFGLQELPFRPLAAIVTDYVRDKQLLLILDNCEHLIAACAHLANDLLHQGARLKILASSREALGIAGEVAYRVPSLAEAESNRLFVERAQAVNSKFAAGGANADTIAQICTRLDGIPLAIELAAARAKLLTPEQIAVRLNDCFRLLVGGSRTALPRQQTLRALIDWSYDLLPESEQRLLRLASVFAGGWTLEALEAVADAPDVLENLEQLVNKSLVVTEERGRVMRYYLLETIRQYAREKLFEAKESAAARDRHFFYFAALSEKLWQGFRESHVSVVIASAKEDLENFWAALDWGLENRVDESVGLAANLCALASIFGFDNEALALTATAVQRARALPPANAEADFRRQKLIAKAIFMQGFMGMGTGNIPVVLELLREAITLSRANGDKVMLGYSLEMYYTAASFIDMPDRDAAALEGYEIFTKEVEDSFGLSMAQVNMARLAASRGDETAKAHYVQLMREKTGNEGPMTFQKGILFLGLGVEERTRGHLEAAKKHFEDGLTAFQSLGHRTFIVSLRSELGHVARTAGDLAEAEAIYRDTIKDWQALGNRPAVANQLECFAFLAIADEEPQRALKLLGAAEVLREQTGAPMADYEQVEYAQAVAQLRAMLPEAEFNAHWTVGRTLTLAQAVDAALGEGPAKPA